MATANFRAGVVAVVTNSRGELLAFERSDVPGAWQLPQGGIDVGEAPLDTAWRELQEETGLDARHVDLVAEFPTWVAYELPERVRRDGRRLGQVQRWFTFRVKDDAVEPTPDEIEFVAWRWVDAAWLVDHVVDFRREAYRTALTDTPTATP
jgi:putative (di)nucleoside polyphosphate hydrolase